MARHASTDEASSRPAKLVPLAALWLIGLATALTAALAAAARYGCMPAAHGFACQRTGSVLGMLIAAAALVVIIVCTVLTRGKQVRRVRLVTGVGVLLTLVLFTAAAMLLASA